MIKKNIRMHIVVGGMHDIENSGNMLVEIVMNKH